MPADWTKLRTEYVHGTCTMRELAEKHGIKAAGVMRRAAKEGWDAERKQRSADVSKRADAALADARAYDLAAFNADDLKLARALRASVAANMRNGPNLHPQDLRALAGVAEAAQRIGRLALGVPTERTASTVTIEHEDDARAAEIAERLERGDGAGTRH